MRFGMSFTEENFVGWNHLNLTTQAYLRDNDKIGVGLRPYGLHAGNMAALVAYPYLLCEQYKAVYDDPHFTYQVWLNDIEAVTNVGEDGQRKSANAANMYPGGTSFQHTPAPDNFPGSLVDYWQPLIENVVRGTIGRDFPNVKIEFKRASKELTGTTQFKQVVQTCLESPDQVAGDVELATRQKIKGPKEFVWPLHPQTHQPLSQVKLEHTPDGIVVHGTTETAWNPSIKTRLALGFLECARQILEKCGLQRAVRPVMSFLSRIVGQAGEAKRETFRLESLDFLTQFRVLQAARLSNQDPALWVVGIDHLGTNRSGILQDLIARSKIPMPRLNFLHVPLLFTGDDKKMSKSLGNAQYVDPWFLIATLRNNFNPGLNMRHAPVSEDILVIGEQFLPPHMCENLPARQAAVASELEAYRNSDALDQFIRDNRPSSINRGTIAGIVGVPHL